MPPKGKERLKILLLNENGIWTALCLNHYLVAQAAPGELWEGALQAFNLTYWLQFQSDQKKGIAPFSNLSKAPKEYWEIFKTAVPVLTRFELRPPFSLSDQRDIPPDEVRVAA